MRLLCTVLFAAASATSTLEPIVDGNIWTLPGEAWRALPRNVSVQNYTCTAHQQASIKKDTHGCCNGPAADQLPLPPSFTLDDLLARWAESTKSNTTTTTVVNFGFSAEPGLVAAGRFTDEVAVGVF